MPLDRRRFIGFLITSAQSWAATSQPRHLLYVASPGIRNYEEYGGVGVLVFDIDQGYRFVRRIPTWDVPSGAKPENVKGIVASARTGKLYVSTYGRILALDAVRGDRLWDKAYDGGCDRLAISPDGATLYVPQFEGPSWHVVNASNGDVEATIWTKSGSHNTICAPDGSVVYLAGLRSTSLSLASTATRTVTGTVGPFSDFIRPFTVNGSGTLCFVNVNGLPGFEVGDIRTGRKLYRVEVQGYKPGPLKRHGCPSHGIALTPDERELWVVDGANNAVHIFDATVMPPKQGPTIQLRDFPGWISFSIDGRFAYASTGEIIDVATRKIVAGLKDETGRQVQSEKLLDLIIENGKVVQAGNQFGIGMRRK
ncbi:MAG: hypothetical protein U0Q18_36945 [Bryobacteraceae bacterium]